MRTVTEIFNVYTFSELSEKAKDRVRESYGESLEPFFFTEDCEYYLNSLLPNSKLEVEYDLSYCQGDFFSIHGTAYLSDILAKISDNYTDKELKYLRWLIKEWVRSVEISRGCYYRSDYFHRNKIDFAETVIDDMEYNGIRDIREDLIRKFEKNIYDYLNGLCHELKNDGYSFFYDYTDRDIEEWCECNEWEFYEDGRFYA